MLELRLFFAWFILASSLQSKPYLWVYWENKSGKTMPGFISLCRKTLLKHCNNSFTIVELDNNNIYTYLPELKEKEKEFNFDHLHIAQKVDYYRVLLLATYGGLYIDSDMIVMRDLKEITNKLTTYDFVGFGSYTESTEHYGYPENGVMASRAHGTLITNLLKRIEELLPKKRTAKLHYAALGRTPLQEQLQLLLASGKYAYFHYPSTVDGTRDKSGAFISMDHMFADATKNPIEYANPKDLLFITLYNNMDSGISKRYRAMTEDDLLNQNINFTKFVTLSLEPNISN